MGIVDKAKQFVTQHEEKIDSAAAKAGEFVDRKTGGKYSDKIDRAVDGVRRATGDSPANGDQASPGDAPGDAPGEPRP